MRLGGLLRRDEVPRARGPHECELEEQAEARLEDEENRHSEQLAHTEDLEAHLGQGWGEGCGLGWLGLGFRARSPP